MGSITRHIARLFAAVLILAAVAQAQTQTAPQAAGGGITHEQAEQILQELRQIRQLLANGGAAGRAAQPTQAAQNGKVSIAGLPVLGRTEAPLTMVEFSDYQCPFCRAFNNGTFDELKKNWIDTGRLRFVSWDMPLVFHSNAAKAAQAARCAGEQNKFWELRALLIANAAKLAPEDVLGYAQQVPQLDFARFKACVQADKYAEEIKKAGADGNTQGISGTPTFLIAKSKGDVVEGVIFVGAQPYAAFDTVLKEQLGK